MPDTIILHRDDLTRRTGQLSLEQCIDLWLAAKFSRSYSEKTRRAYHDTLLAFRAALQAAALDLDGSSELVTLAAQGWAGRDSPKAATRNQRLAILSSFYKLARKHRPDLINPIEGVDRAPTQAYAEARALDTDDLRQRLQAIDRTTLLGKRDYALLSVGLQTGRRASELAGLRWGDIEVLRGRVTLTWRRTKGGKVMRDTLPQVVSAVLLDYLQAQYGDALAKLPKDGAVWMSQHKKALSVRMIAVMCEKRLGTSRIHALRHTFARTMESVGAKVSEIQARLGHKNIATTGIYLAALVQDENSMEDVLAASFGIDQ